MNFDSKATEEYYCEKIQTFLPFHINRPKITLWTKEDVDKLIELLEVLNMPD